MPIYEYCCSECQQVFEEWQKDFSDRDIPCPVCGGTSKRLISNTSFILKGSGWYVTDYCNRNGGSTGEGSDNGKSNGTEAKKENSDKATSDTKETKSAETSQSK